MIPLGSHVRVANLQPFDPWLVPYGVRLGRVGKVVAATRREIPRSNEDSLVVRWKDDSYRYASASVVPATCLEVIPHA
jgi:hypothetical protein